LKTRILFYTALKQEGNKATVWTGHMICLWLPLNLLIWQWAMCIVKRHTVKSTVVWVVRLCSSERATYKTVLFLVTAVRTLNPAKPTVISTVVIEGYTCSDLFVLKSEFFILKWDAQVNNTFFHSGLHRKENLH
jgi:hypothetical protein